MYGFIYITTNIINNKKYIGRKKYSKGWETYLGSSKLLKADIKVYGVESFKRDILEECANKESLAEREVFWQLIYNVKESSEYYNIVIANQGFDTSGTKFTYSEEHKNKIWSKERRELSRNRWLDKNCNPNYKEDVRVQRSKRMKESTSNFFKSEMSRVLASRQNCKPFVLEYNGGDYYFENRFEAAKIFSISAVNYVIKTGYKVNNPFKGLKFKKWL